MSPARLAKAAARRRSPRTGETKRRASVTLQTTIDAAQHDALQAIAFSERRPLRDIVQEALRWFIAQHPARRLVIATKR